MLTSNALDTFHSSVLLFPDSIDGGVAVNEFMVGGGVTVTVTVFGVGLRPPAAVPVIVYVVVVVGLTVTVPLVGKLPLTPEIETLVKPTDVHESVLELPLTIVEGVASKVTMFG